MALFRSGNPAMKPEVFAKPQTWSDFQGSVGAAVEARPNVMTLNGTIGKTGVLLGICAATAIAGWNIALANPESMWPIGIGGALVGLILGLIMYGRPKTAPYLAPVYAVCEGAFVAWASLMWSAYAREAGGTAGSIGTGLVLQAGLLTFTITAAMLVAYATRLVRPSAKVVGGIAAATLGVLLFSLANVLMAFIFPGAYQSLWSSPLGIAIAGVVVVIAAANLVVDFAVVEQGIQSKAPKYMEWYAGFGILVTVVWLYVSILRLLALLSRRN